MPRMEVWGQSCLVDETGCSEFVLVEGLITEQIATSSGKLAYNASLGGPVLHVLVGPGMMNLTLFRNLKSSATKSEEWSAFA